MHYFTKVVAAVVVMFSTVGLFGMHHHKKGKQNRPPKQYTVAMSLDRNTGQWNVLLAAKQGVDRKGNKKEVFWKCFEDMARETNGLVQGRGIIGAVTDPSGHHDVFNFVEVGYIKGSDLYKGARGSGIDDFVWVPLSQIQGQRTAQVKTKKGATHPVDGLLLWALGNMPAVQQAQAGGQAVPQHQFAGQQGDWRTIRGAILFNKPKDGNFYLTNYERSPINVGGRLWSTVEHYFQAQKSTNSQEQENIRMARTADDARTAGRNVRHMRRDWNTHCFQAMREGLNAKFTQNQVLQRQLLSTGNQILVENAGQRDAKWGAGADGRGENHLGRMLMVVRQSLLDSQGANATLYNYDPATTLTYAQLQQHGFRPAAALHAQQATPTITTTVATSTPPFQPYRQPVAPVQVARPGVFPTTTTTTTRTREPQQAHRAYVFYYIPGTGNIVLTRNAKSGVVGAHEEPCYCRQSTSHRKWINFDQSRFDPAKHSITSLDELMGKLPYYKELMDTVGIQEALDQAQIQGWDVNFVQSLLRGDELGRFVEEALNSAQ